VLGESSCWNGLLFFLVPRLGLGAFGLVAPPQAIGKSGQWVVETRQSGRPAVKLGHGWCRALE